MLFLMGQNRMTGLCLALLAEGASTFEQTPGINIGIIVMTSDNYAFESPSSLDGRCLELQKDTR